jgi:hypothetical protein
LYLSFIKNNFMKKIIIGIMLLIFSSISSAQETPAPTTTPKNIYLEKSKAQKTTAWILFGSGVAMLVGGVIAYQSGPGGLFMMAIGVLAPIVSVPLFIASGKNKRKAMSAGLSLKFESSQAISSAEIICRSYPAISLKLHL